MRLPFCLGLLLALSGCEFLTGAANDRPSVHLAEGQAMLVQPPSLSALALYYCGKHLDPLVCLPFGPPPTKEELQFRFQLRFEIANPLQVPVPTTEIMVGLHLYPGETVGELGAVCTTFCEAGASDCPIPPRGACVYKETDIDSVEEFLAGAAMGGLVLAAEAANGKPIARDLGLTTVPAGGKLTLKVTFAIGIDPMIALIEKKGGSLLTEVLTSGGKSLDIPYSVGGRLWFSVPYVGRVTVGFGPYGDPPEAPLVWKVL